jgi:hypothetical protein
VQSFVAGHSVAYTFISEEQRAGPAINRTSEHGGAMKVYGTVAMNYVQFSACEGSIVRFQHATVETLERFRWWCFLRNRRRTEANEYDQERKY